MGSGVKPGDFVRSSILTLGLLLLPFIPFDLSGHLFDFIGRLHPLIVHFPIVLIIITAIFEWLQGHSQSHHIQRIFSSLYAITAVSSLLAVFIGFLLFKNGDYEGAYIDRHLWGGIIISTLVLWAQKCRKIYLVNKKWRVRQIYRTFIFSAFFGVIYTSHLGGSITHGSEYLTEPLQKLTYQNQLHSTDAFKQPESLNFYTDIIQPIFKGKCIKCHNDAKTKGGFNMNTYAKLLAGGKSEKPGITPGSLIESELYKRVTLPTSHADYMPPDGKTPLDSIELALLKWWISSGASSSDTLGAMVIDSNTQQVLDQYLPNIAAAQVAQSKNRKARLKLSPKLIRLGAKNGLKIQSDPRGDSIYYTASMQIPPQSVGDAQISALLPYRDLFSKISLVGANISEEGLYYLSQMPNLREIILVKCCVKGEGLVHLAKLKHLQLLNLSYTDLTNEHAMQLSAFPNLKEVYLFNTYVEPKILNLLDNYLKETKVSFEEGPYF